MLYDQSVLTFFEAVKATMLEINERIKDSQEDAEAMSDMYRTIFSGCTEDLIVGAHDKGK